MEERGEGFNIHIASSLLSKLNLTFIIILIITIKLLWYNRKINIFFINLTVVFKNDIIIL